MKFSVGDPVYVISAKEEGVIVEIIDMNTAKIRMGTAVFHAFFEDLEHPYLRWFLKEQQQQKGKKVFIENIQTEKFYQRQSKLPSGVYLICFPQYQIEGMEERVEKVKLLLYNETNHNYTFSYIAKSRTETFFELENNLYAHAEFYIHDLSFEIFANSPVFAYKFTNDADPRLEIESQLTLKPKKIHEYLEGIKYENHPFFSILLFEKIVEKPIEVVNIDTLSFKKSSKEKIQHFDFSTLERKSRYEIDLHIEKLVENSEHLSSSGKLQVQLREFEKSLDLAMITHQRSVVFIHGVGKGILKTEIHKILSSKQQKKKIRAFTNNYDIRYGYGATEVFF
jgi:hypothetical protein